MTQTLSAVFHSRDLPGDFLVIPVRAYHQFFAGNIRASSGWAKTAWIVGNVMTGFFAYPILGVFALIGMLIKSTGIPGLCKHNQQQIAVVNLEQTGTNGCKEGYVSLHRSPENQDRHSYKTFTVTPQNHQTEFSRITAAIEDCSRKLMNVHVEFRGTINVYAKTGALDVRLFINTSQAYVEPVAKPVK